MPNFFIIEPVDNRARRLPFTGAGVWRPYYVAADGFRCHIAAGPLKGWRMVQRYIRRHHAKIEADS